MGSVLYHVGIKVFEELSLEMETENRKSQFLPVHQDLKIWPTKLPLEAISICLYKYITENFEGDPKLKEGIQLIGTTTGKDDIISGLYSEEQLSYFFHLNKDS